MTENDPDDAGGNPDERLPQLAQKLNHHHKLAEEAEITAIQEAWHAGDALHEAKKIVKHGEFMRWVKANFDGHHSKATRYMQVRSYCADPHNLPEVSVTAALKLISGGGDGNSLEPSGSMLGSEWLRILHEVEPFAEHDATVPMFNKMLIEATGSRIVAFATDRLESGVAYARYQGSQFAVTLDLPQVHTLIGLAKNVVRDPSEPWKIELGVSDHGELFGCRIITGFGGSESHTVAVSSSPLEIDFRERIRSAFAAGGEVCCFDAQRLAQFTRGQGDVVMSARTNKAAVVQRGDNFIGLLMPQPRPNRLIEWALPDWLTKPDEAGQ